MKDAAKKVVMDLQEAGFEAFFVGGCVRDELLGIEPKDFDIVTSALPSEVEGLFSKKDSIGKHFGVIMVHLDGFSFEVATYRSDIFSEKSNGRHPDSVKFGSIKDDADRRDFTVNAIYLNPINGEVQDFHNGREDLKNKVIRFIGDPHERIKEDGLRMLRALKFSGRYGFSIDKGSLEAISQEGKSIKKVSSERVYNELKQILSNQDGTIMFSLSRIYLHIFGEYSDYVFHHNNELSFEGFVANMFKYIYDIDLQNKLEKLCFEKKSIKKIMKLRRAHNQIYCNSVCCEDHLNQVVIFENYDVVKDLFIMSGFTCEPPELPSQLVFASDLILEYQGKDLGEKIKSLRVEQFLNPEITKDELLRL